MAVIFDFAQLLEDPIFLGSFGLAVVGWIVALAGQCASNLTLKAFGPVGPFSWFILFFNFVVIVGALAVVSSNKISQYRPALMAFFSACFVFDSSIVSLFIHLDSSYQAAGAGYIFLSIVFTVWIIVLGSDNQQRTKAAAYSSTGVIIGSNVTPTMIPLSQSSVSQNQVVVSPNAEYAYKARALYDYTASPEDPNELNFSKDDVLDIVDNKGKWWQARRADGVIGIVPSNYLQII